MAPFNTVIQSTAIDLLQAIVARGENDHLALEGIQAAVIGKLYFSVHAKRLELQNKLLHLLHSVISAITAAQDTRPIGAAKSPIDDGIPERPISRTGPQDAAQGRAVNPLLIQTLIDGIVIPSNRPVLQSTLR